MVGEDRGYDLSEKSGGTGMALVLFKLNARESDQKLTKRVELM